MHYLFSNLNRLDVDRLDDADQEWVENARNLLEEVSLLTWRDGGNGTDIQLTPNWSLRLRSGEVLQSRFIAPNRCAGASLSSSTHGGTASYDEIDRSDCIGYNGSASSTIRKQLSVSVLPTLG